jgi:hypothetical protein
VVALLLGVASLQFSPLLRLKPGTKDGRGETRQIRLS